MNVNDIIKKAISLGACNESGKASDWKSLCWLFFSPQGREFCEESNFPSLKMFQGMKRDVYKYGVYVDSGDISLFNQSNIGVIGDTYANIIINDNTKVHKIMLMHGGKAIINIGNYAVALIVNVGDCEVNVINDGTARIL